MASTNTNIDLTVTRQINGTIKEEFDFTQAFWQYIYPELKLVSLANRSYEASAQGQGVFLPTFEFRPTIHDYDILNGVPLEQVTNGTQFYPITNHKAINVLLDGYEMSSSATSLNMLSEIFREVGQAIGEEIETSVLARVTDATNGVQYSPITTAIPTGEMARAIQYEIKELAKPQIRPGRSVKTKSVRNGLVALLSHDAYFDLKQEIVYAQISAESAYNSIFINGQVPVLDGVPLTTLDFMPDNIPFFIIQMGRTINFVELWKSPVQVREILNGEHIDASNLSGRLIYDSFIVDRFSGVIRSVA
jgi:hypothetical protein